MGKRQSLQQIVLGRLDSYMKKNEAGPLSHTMHTNSKWVKQKCETSNHKNPGIELKQ